MWRFNRDHLMAPRCLGVGAVHPIIPAKAGIHSNICAGFTMDSGSSLRFARNDGDYFGCLGVEKGFNHIERGGAETEIAFVSL